MKQEIIMYGADWCKDCLAAKEILHDRNLNYTLNDITDPKNGEEYSQIVMDINDGKRIIPTFVIGDDYYANPRPAELNRILDELKDDSEDDVIRCSSGNILEDGDSVLLTRDLDVKGSSLMLKQGQLLENIKLTSDSTHVDVKIGKSIISIKVAFVKKRG